MTEESSEFCYRPICEERWRSTGDFCNCDAGLGSRRKVNVVRADSSCEGQAELLGLTDALRREEGWVEGCGDDLQGNDYVIALPKRCSLSVRQRIHVVFISGQRSALQLRPCVLLCEIIRR